MNILEAWRNYNAETDLLYGTNRLVRPFHFVYLYVFTTTYKEN